ncbi:hypothetical protein ACQPW3_01180 [Actinosynnema sp. CA-248983]
MARGLRTREMEPLHGGTTWRVYATTQDGAPGMRSWCATGGGRRTTGGGRRTADDGRRATGDGRRTTGGGRRATGDGRRATGGGRRAAGDGRRAAGAVIPTPKPVQRIELITGFRDPARVLMFGASSARDVAVADGDIYVAGLNR